jgi:predicted nucleic-acid-binding protein
MIGVDTNVLVRFLSADDPVQYPFALKFFESRTPADPAFVSAVTLAETVWVLRRSHGFSVAEIMGAVRLLLDSGDFVIEGRDDLEAIRQEGANPSQIADYLVAHLGRKAGCSHTVTFDKRAAAHVHGMELLA